MVGGAPGRPYQKPPKPPRQAKSPETTKTSKNHKTWWNSKENVKSDFNTKKANLMEFKEDCKKHLWKMVNKLIELKELKNKW